jgi:predicted NodU family carbamoyl transferase/ferredoxin
MSPHATLRGPLTCHFGTRLSPEAVCDDLRHAGLLRARLEVRDEGLRLVTPDPDVRRDDVARALTALRARFSPLTAVSVAGDASLAPEVTLVDARTAPPEVVALAEVFDPEGGFPAALHDLLRRLPRVAAPSAAAPPTVRVASLEDPLHAGFAAALGRALEALGFTAAVSVLAPTRTGERALRSPESPAGSALHVLLWLRPGGASGVRQAVLLGASWRAASVTRLAALLCGDVDARRGEPDVLLDGLVWRVGRRPTVAAPRTEHPRSAIAVDPDRCTSCGRCAEVCPTGYLDASAQPTTPDLAGCVRCHECVEHCPVDAIRPRYDDDAGTLGRALAHRPTWLTRLTGAPGPLLPAAFPPSWLAPRPFTGPEGRPRWVLGLAVMTQQEHAAALLRDGALVGAVEHERLARVRHGGWHAPGRPGVTAAVDPTLALEEVVCRRPVRALLEAQGITLDDVELIAVNGLHGRYVQAIPFLDARRDIPTVRAGRVLYVPHHRAHAASAWRLSGGADAWVLTVDGRGDRESAALWRGEGGALRLAHTLLALTDRSIGGVYEGVTRLLGFGSHGQGSTMALAAFGAPTVDLAAALGDDGDCTVAHEASLDALSSYRVVPQGDLTQSQKDLAASAQAALEHAMGAFVARGVGEAPVDALAVAGGVALNCRMNESLRQRFGLAEVFVQPGANDAGTALGAALEAWSRFDDRPSPRMAHAMLGPAFDDDAMERALRHAGLRYTRAPDIADEVAARLAGGQVVCWFQGAMEFGPRALGGRSILADPRDPAMHARVNAMKSREPWRPFGPSVLAGHEGAWFERAFDARFMVFTLPVRPAQRARVPAVVHVDGSARPQVVHADTHPRYHAMISAFFARTGVPMVLNTSFNRRGEPIVCTPEDALESFVALGADALAMGPFLVEPVAAEAAVNEAALASLAGGRRLALRITTETDLAPAHCTLADLRERTGGRARRFDEALRALAEGRRAGCDELVVMRGEATLRPDLPGLVRRARAMGYRYVQVQTDGHALASAPRREALLAAGVDAFEVTVRAGEEALFERLSGVPGSFRPTVLALHALARAGRVSQVTVPLLRSNLRGLGAVVAMLAKLGVKRVQFGFPRPVELREGVMIDELPRLEVASVYLRQALALAARSGLAVTTEAVPFCHLPPEARGGGEAAQDWSRHRVDDLHVLHESAAVARGTQRPDPPPCRGCAARDACPRTWALYLELVGSDELRPLDA